MKNRTPDSARIDWFLRYCSRQIAPSIGAASSSTAPPQIEFPGLGRKSDLALVRWSGGAGLAVRRIRSLTEARRLEAIDRLLARHDLPAPRLRYAATGLWHWLRHGCAVLAEDRIDGGHPPLDGGADLQALQKLAAALARLHRDESPAWGPPDRLRNGDGFDELVISKIRNRLQDVERMGESVSAADRRRILDFAESFREAWGDGRPFVLTHGKLKPANVILTAEGGVCFIDWATMAFAPPGADLVNFLERFPAGKAAQSAARAAYFAELPAGRAARFDALEPLHRAYYQLSRWAAKERRLKKPRWEDGDPKTLDAARDALWRWIDANESRIRQG